MPDPGDRKTLLAHMSFKETSSGAKLLFIPRYSSDTVNGGYVRRPRVIDDRDAGDDEGTSKCEQYPLSDRASKLLADYFARSAFWFALKNLAPVDWAGEHILDVKKSRAHQILKELEESGGPLSWFRGQYIQGIHAGTMGRGRDTEPSAIADAFFCALEDDNESVRAELCGLEPTSLQGLRRMNQGCDTQIISYFVFKELARKGRDQ